MTRREEMNTARRRVAWSVLVSSLVHLAGIVAIAWFYVANSGPPPDRVEEIEITFIEPPSQAGRARPKFVDSAAPESKPQEQAVFESERNTAATAPEAPQGAEPVPTQEGREEPMLELEQQALALAKPADAPPAPEIPSQEPAPPEPPRPPELQKPPKAEEISTKPDETGAVALAKNEPQREEQSRNRPPPAPPPSRPSFQRQARATRLRGSIDSSGRASVASLSTPLGRYRKAISDAVGSSWYYHIGSRMDMFSYGTLTVLFTIDKDGKARQPKVLSNTSNESFEIVTLESILAAEIPPIPPDVLPALEGGRIEIDYSFSIITN